MGGEKYMKEPKLRFKADDGSDFPDWEEKKLGDIANRVTRKNKRNIADIPLTISSVDGLIDQRNFFNKVVASRDMSGYYLLKNGEFAYNKSYSKGYDFGSIKRLDLYNQGALSTLYICFALNENENSDFYQKYFDSLSWYPELQKICAEGARNHGLLNVPTNDFFKIKLRVPKVKDEQQKIADFLSTIDTIIEKQRAMISAWEERKKGVMQKLFSQEVRFKADDGSDFPELEAKSLFDICEYKNKQSVGKNYVGTENMKQNFSGLESLDEETEMKGVCYCKGDTLMSNIRPYLRKTWKADREGVCSTDVLVFHPIDVVSEYLHYLIASDKFISYVMTGVKGVKMPRGDKEHMMKFSIMVPSLPEQQKIADCLSALDAVIEKQKETLEKWQELKKGLLQQMFV